MAWAPIERWLDQGWSPFRVTYTAVSAVIFAVAVYGYVSHPHHPGWLWYALGALGIFALWAITEMLRWRIRHNRLEHQLAGSDTPHATAPSQAHTMDRFEQLRDVTRPEGSITAGKDIKAGRDIQATGEVIAGGSIEAGQAPPLKSAADSGSKIPTHLRMSDSDLIEALAVLLLEGRTALRDYDTRLWESMASPDPNATMADVLPGMEAALKDAPRELREWTRQFDLRAVDSIGPGEAVLMMGAPEEGGRDDSPEKRALGARLNWVTKRIEKLTGQ
jgi:hypothetical protein